VCVCACARVWEEGGGEGGSAGLRGWGGVR
jgi:hypothetical protein